MYIAKILVEEGKEVKVGDPVMITVEEEEDAAKFGDFVVPSSGVTTSTVPPPSTEKASEPQNIVKTPTQQIKKDETALPSAQPSPAPPAPAPQVVPQPNPNKLFWGKYVSQSPLVAKMLKDQEAYVERYGSCCHRPINQ